jgi:hypothetical protein
MLVIGDVPLFQRAREGASVSVKQMRDAGARDEARRSAQASSDHVLPSTDQAREPRIHARIRANASLARLLTVWSQSSFMTVVRRSMVSVARKRPSANAAQERT